MLSLETTDLRGEQREDFVLKLGKRAPKRCLTKSILLAAEVQRWKLRGSSQRSPVTKQVS
jgi:hypothetical protein